MLKRCLTICLLITISGATFGQSAAVRYIELYKAAAVRIMKESGIPASIVLGVAIHESGSGTSKIARILNNHFGFKGRNDSKHIQSAYKGYDSVEASYADFASALKSRSQYKSLFEKYSPFDYYSWARGIQRAGYASSHTWASQVLAIIKKYELYQFDNRPVAYYDSAPQSLMYTNTAISVYRVRKGDTLSGIAKKHHTTVKAIQEDNGLKNTDLSIGQKLKL